MEKSFGQKDYDWDGYFDEVILKELALGVFCGDVEHSDYSSSICLTSLEYFLLENFEIQTFEELQDLKMRVQAKVIDLEGGSNLSNYECEKPKGFFRNR